MAVQVTESSPAVTLGPAVALSCRECGQRFDLGPLFACQECFGPLEVAYDLPAGDPDGLRKRIESGPNNIWRYAPCCPSPRTSPASPASTRG